MTEVRSIELPPATPMLVNSKDSIVGLKTFPEKLSLIVTESDEPVKEITKSLPDLVKFTLAISKFMKRRVSRVPLVSVISS